MSRIICDLLISGLVGLEIKEDGIDYQGKTITIVYDKNGSKYKLPSGLTILVDGERVAHSKKLKPLEIKL